MSTITDIFKVQIPIISNEDNPPAFVYNRSRTIVAEVEISDVKDHMKNRYKAFFEIEINREGEMKIVKEAKWQDW